MAKAPLILICDDQPIIHETLGVYLDNKGFRQSPHTTENRRCKWRRRRRRT